MLTLALSLAALAGAPLPSSPAVAPAVADTVHLKADHVHTPDGVVADAIVTVRDGKIVSIGQAAPDGATVVELEGHLSAGMVALSDRSGLPNNEAQDVTRMVMDGADLAHAFTRKHSDYDRLAAEGITSVVLTPPNGSLCGGRTALVKPGGTVVVPRAHLHLAFASAMFVNGRKPTSYAGAIEMLEAEMADPTGGFQLLKNGDVGALLQTGTRAEAGRAIAFAERHGLAGTVYGCARIGDLAADLARTGLGAALPAWSPGGDEHVPHSAKALAKAKVPFGFALDAPARHPASLRLAAAACVRQGLDAGAAWEALTVHPANLGGARGRVGALAPGFDADLVLWNGHPMELTSAVLRVWIDGTSVHESDLPEKEDEE